MGIIKPDLQAKGAITNDAWIESLLQFKGVGFSLSQSSVWKVDGKWSGVLRCHALTVCAMIAAGLLPDTFDPNFSPATYDQPEAKTLFQFFNRNFTPIEYGDRRPGDVAIFVFPVAKHIGHFIEDRGEEAIFHVSQNAGRVQAQPYDCTFDERLHAIGRLKNLID